MRLSEGAICFAYNERLNYRNDKFRPNLCRSAVARGRKFKSLFGLTIEQTTRLWNVLDRHNDTTNWKPIHLLDALYFLKVYPTESVHAAFSGADEKTLRKWNWKIIEAIAELPCVRRRSFVGACAALLINQPPSSSSFWFFSPQIQWENRLINDNGSTCKITVDGTDFRIYEPTPFSSRWYSHKFKGPGLRYELGVCIQTGEIVWVNGPFPCGDYPDLRIAREGLIYALAASPVKEMAVADGGYNDGYEFFDTPTGINDNEQYMRSIARARHETINNRLKNYGALQKRWRHSRNLHGVVFHAVVNLTHLAMSMEGTRREHYGSFQVEYNDK